MHALLPSLVVCSGKLLLVGRLLKKVEERSILGHFPLIKHTLVGIWELDNSNEWSWSLISITPQGCPAEDLVDCFPRKAVCGTLSIHDKLSLFD
ncbi:hypothetical protein SUGI_1006600 [Cryptomeria japonica]|nr:hypothetical protein SUGI_1006600 [Cryptomeria japonica]